MNERKGIVFSIYEDNLPVEGCTISKELVNEPDYQLFYFSLAAHTDISPETYQKAKVIYVLSGGLSFTGRPVILKSLQGRHWSCRQALLSV